MVASVPIKHNSYHTSLQAQALYDQAKDLESSPSYDQVGARAKYTEAAGMGFALAQYEMGNYAYYGRGGYSGNDADEAEALKFWTLAADQDNFDAASKIGMLYYYGRNWLPQDNTKAKAFLQKGNDAGHYESMSLYQGILQREEYLQHEAEAVQAVIKNADGGDVEARFQTAKYYENGATGLEKDTAKALEYLRLAADEGALATAQVYLGNAYDYGNLGLTEDDVVALEWYRRAADQGNEDGQFKVGEFYENGFGGLEKSIDTAKEFYAKGGYSGQAAIDRIEEPERNRAEVARLTEAVANGEAKAQAELGRLAEFGQKGVAEDKARAEELYRLSADQGNDLGQYYLGLYYVKAYALKYFTLAADQGNSDASSAKYRAENYF
jgi:TPR repeat protein